MNMQVFFVSLVGLLALVSLSCSPKPTFAQQPSNPPTQVVVVNSPLWVTTVVHEPQFKRLADAIAVAFHYVPEFRPIADAAARKKTAVHWGHLHGPDGAYHRHTNTIVIDRKLETASLAYLASTIAHEAQHAVNTYVNTSGDCMLNEINSFDLDAWVWLHLKDNFRARTHDPREQFQDELLKAREQGRLAAFVMNMEHYRRHCGLCR